jgi:hypothetical protein
MNKQDIKLKEIPEPLWTEELLLHFIKYGWNEYGFEKDGSYKDQADYINSLKEVMKDLQNGTQKSFLTNGVYDILKVPQILIENSSRRNI